MPTTELLPILTPSATGDGRPFGAQLDDLDWIDDFVSNVRPYVRVRAEDNVLIKMPTDVFPLNRSGVLLVERTLRGETAQSVAISLGALDHPERIWEIHAFFCDIRDLLSNRLGDGQGRLATNTTRYQGSFTRYPVLSEIALTYRCNLACSFCYAGCGTPDARPGNAVREKHPDRWKLWQNTHWWPWRRPDRDPLHAAMSSEEVERVIDEIALVGKVPSVSFTGGECTLRPDLPRVIATRAAVACA